MRSRTCGSRPVDRKGPARQDFTIDGLFGQQSCKIVFRRDVRAVRPPIESGKKSREAIDVVGFQSAGCEQSVEHEPVRQTAHDDDPFNRRAFAVERQGSRGRERQWRHPQIDVGRQTTIKRELGLAIRFSGFEGRKIRKGQADRLFDFVGAVAGKKNQRYMGLNHLDRRTGVAIGGRTRQESHLLRKPDARAGKSRCSTIFLWRFSKIRSAKPKIPSCMKTHSRSSESWRQGRSICNCAKSSGKSGHRARNG